GRISFTRLMLLIIIRIGCSGAKRFNLQSAWAKKIAASRLTHATNQSLHVIQVTLQGAPARGGKTIFSFGCAPIERFRTTDVARILELPRMDAKIAVSRLHRVFELVKGQ